MALAFIVGRIIFAVYFLNSAYAHLFKSGGLVGYAGSKGVKSAKLAVVGTGILLLIGGLTILLGVRPHYGIACLVIFLIGVSFKMHAYWKETDPSAKMNDHIQFMKNMALVGALLMMYAIPSPWTYALNW